LSFAVEFATLTLDPITGLPQAKIFRPTEVDELLVKQGLGKKDDEAKDVEMKT
jgi:20S proteasome subunit alpha 3